jgi:hypothetical protein
MVAVGHTAEWPTSTLPKDDAGTPSPASSFLRRLRQHGFELPLHPFKRAAQLDDDGTMRQVGAVYVHVRVGHRSALVNAPLTIVAYLKPRHAGDNGC